MRAYDTVLFDLDGTILDTNELIIISFLHALEGVAEEGFSREHIIPSMGAPLVDQMRRFSGLDNVDHLIDAYREVNLRLHDQYVKLFEQVEEVLADLHADGVKLGVVTTKMRLTTDRGLAFTNIAKYMDVVITIDDVQHAKPHAEPVQKALQGLGADPQRALMVGDSTVDIQSGINAGVKTVGVSWSLKGEQVLREAGAHYIIQSMQELYDIVGLERR
ncbi:pyrophosphatase PpaX [Paenibacillus montaniterrae]|uniref:Pyrophosphatase PpaX n=1 Tax=Paenibacillus montaniterrae TaxID=429341 RepID=A0A919YR13_9BACL|nr:pyrophosphatase PpaX [Paenibacillus montaniterrae]GIP17845.1 pyrophosphatase PpaX [Paenibacillus montaniterrae]